MASTLKVLPVDDTVSGAPNSSDAVVRYRSGVPINSRVPTSELEASDVDTIAPLRNGSLSNIIAIGDAGFLTSPLSVKKPGHPPPQLTPLPHLSAPHHSSQQRYHPAHPGTLKRGNTVQELLAGPSKASLIAKQNALIEKRSKPGQHSTLVRCAYFLDQYISTRRGQTISLACVGLVFTFLGGCVLKASQPSVHFTETIWQSWTFLGDAGSHTSLTEPVRCACCWLRL